MAYNNKNQMYKKEKDPAEMAAVQKNTAIAVQKMLIKNQDIILNSMPQGFNFDRMCRAIIFSINSNYELAKCTPASIFTSTVRGFLMGLEPNGPLGEGYLVPFWNTKKYCSEAQFIPGYRGLQSLARRSGEITECYAKVVKENDIFDVEEGTERKIIHKPNYTKDRGKLVCVYAVFKTRDAVDFEVMSGDEIENIHARSKAGDSGPWVTDYEEMAKKTVVRRLLKRAPMSIDLSRAVDYDNKMAMGEFDKANDIIDMSEFDLSDAETPTDIQGRVNAERTAELREQLKAKSAPVAPAPAEEANPYADYTQLIGQALKETKAPLEMKEVIAYMTANNMTVGVDTDFKQIVNDAANNLC